MHIAQEQLGEATVTIQIDNEEVEKLSADEGERQTRPTGITDRIEGVYSNAKSLIKAIATDLGQEISLMDDNNRPSEIQIGFEMGFSTKAEAWVIGAEANSAFSVSLKWSK